jgi:recombination DNA repair RAD52 pathway protein
MVFQDKDPKGMYKFVFRCDGTLVVKKGGITVVKQDVGVGSGQGAKAEDAIDTAIKSSVTDAMKRCLRLMGPALGGTVYKKSITVPLTKGPIKFQ